MKHSPEAIQSATPTYDYTGWDLDSYASSREWSGVGLVGLSKHRDSDAVERSNFDSALKQIQDKYGKDTAYSVSFSHWAYGWVEIIAYDYGKVELDFIKSMHKSLENYALLDEQLWAEYEWADNHPEADNLCYSEDDCDCELSKA